MKRIIITTITLGATALLAAGCGGSGEPAKAEAGQGMTATELATSMQRDGFADGSEFADASCVKSGKRTFKCLGDLKATDVSMGKAYGTDYSDLTPNEKQQWLEAESGQVTYEVTVGADGNWIAEPTA
jgi:hypothetical protein